MSRRILSPEHRALRKMAAHHLRRARRLRDIEPDLAHVHQTLASLYRRHIELHLEFGAGKSTG